MNKSFNKNWEENVYSKGKQLNLYPYDILVTIVAKKFFDIPFSERKKIKALDLGCGAGNNAKFLAESGFDVFGIDGSASAIKTCRERFEKWGLEGTFVQEDFLELPYQDNFFDLAIDRESLYANYFDTIQKIIGKTHKKMKKGGLFVSFIFNSSHPDIKFGKRIERNTYNRFSEGTFCEAGSATFVDIEEVLNLYSAFDIENIMRHSLREIYNSQRKITEVEEYIITARKK